MRKKWVLFSICVLGIGIVSYFGVSKFRVESSHSKSQHTKYKYFSYFVPVAIAKFTAMELPCVLLDIDNKIVSLELDLGFRGAVCLSTEILDHIEKKTFIRFKKTYGFRGEEYEAKLYKIPQISIGGMSFSNPTVQENLKKFEESASILKEGVKFSIQEQGRIGWELFKSVNLFLDLGNSKIAFCDSVRTLKKQGYLIETFIKTPLLSGKGVIEFQAMTPSGPLLCVLDTGATWNILNIENTEEKSIEQLALDPENVSNIPMFKIGDRDFGPISFHRIPIKLPIQVEAMLGMEFFSNHVVFIDFDENQIYFAPSS